MEQAILRVDFKNKKLIPNQQNNSDFYKNKHTLCDGEVTIFTTSNSGGNWQMRMRVEGHRQYHQKSLRTKNFETAKERAKIEHAVAFVKMTEGKSLFSPTLYKAIELYLEHRAKDVLSINSFRSPGICFGTGHFHTLLTTKPVSEIDAIGGRCIVEAELITFVQ
jgi:hypothetical protein